MKNVSGMVALRRLWRRAVLCPLCAAQLACGGGSDAARSAAAVPAAPQSLAGAVAVAPARFFAIAGAHDDAAAADAVIIDVAPRTGYSIINLGSGELSAIPVINANGQVVYSLHTQIGDRVQFFSNARIQDIGTLGGASAIAPALNDAGQVAGFASNAAENVHAFRWSETGGMVDLGALGDAVFSFGSAINKTGKVAGVSQFIGPLLDPSHAVVWDTAGRLVDLGTLAGQGSGGSAINDAGAVTGNAGAADGQVHAFHWTAAGGMVDIGTLGGLDAYGTHINNAGLVAGFSRAFNNKHSIDYHCFVWTAAGGIVDIGTLGGARSSPWALSESGRIAGVSDVDARHQHAMTWTRRSGLVDLGTHGGVGSSAIGVNNRGQVVGWFLTRHKHYRAFVWSRASGMVDLNRRVARVPAGLELTEALAISDQGEIVAHSNAGLVLLKPGATGTDAPVLGPMTPVEAVRAGTRVKFSAGFVDQNKADTHTARWSWGDGCKTSAVAVSEHNGVGTASAEHTFCTAGLYWVTLTLTDSAGLSSAVTRDVVVIEPSGPVTAGSGRFESPQGAYKQQRMHSGPASFSFALKDKPMAARADADAGMRLRFHVGQLNFESAAYETLSVAGARAEYRGSGKLNGVADYQFELTAVGGSVATLATPGRVRMKIWHTDPRTNAEVLDYDNQRATDALASGGEGSALDAGNILVRH